MIIENLIKKIVINIDGGIILLINKTHGLLNGIIKLYFKF